jgi:hypothetical protein
MVIEIWAYPSPPAEAGESPKDVSSRRGWVDVDD